MRRYTKEQMQKLSQLLKYSDRYEINIQFWPDQIAVYIARANVDLADCGGDFDFAVDSALEYFKRILPPTAEAKPLTTDPDPFIITGQGKV